MEKEKDQGNRMGKISIFCSFILQAVNSADITSETMNLLIAEIKSKNEAFPVEKFYQQLNAKKLNLKAFDRSIAEATLSEGDVNFSL